MLEQMSFIIPGESEQIALIEHMEAESVPATPFAFSVPQEDMDDILRTGGNTTNHRMILAAEFSNLYCCKKVFQKPLLSYEVFF